MIVLETARHELLYCHRAAFPYETKIPGKTPCHVMSCNVTAERLLTVGTGFELRGAGDLWDKMVAGSAIKFDVSVDQYAVGRGGGAEGPWSWSWSLYEDFYFWAPCDTARHGATRSAFIQLVLLQYRRRGLIFPGKEVRFMFER